MFLVYSYFHCKTQYISVINYGDFLLIDLERGQGVHFDLYNDITHVEISF